MNDTQELVDKIKEKSDKIRTLNLLLTDLLNANKLELLDQQTREATIPIIKAVTDKINEISRQ